MIPAEDLAVMGDAEQQMLAQILAAGLPMPRCGRRQWCFHPTRRWRADFGWPDYGLAGVIVEVEGGTWLQSKSGRSAGHAHPARFEEDCIKYDEAALAGITVIRVTPAMIADGRALEYVRRALCWEDNP